MATPMATRIGWADLPGHIRADIERIIGSPVVEAVSQAGGFSPGTADRVRASDGTRAFVKAVAPYLNPDSPALHRREAAIAAALPAEVPAPRLRGSYDDGEWIALVFEDVEGRHPHTPWIADELDAVLAALAALAGEPAPAGLRDLPNARESMRHVAGSWALIAADPPADLDDWTRVNLGRLEAMSWRGVEALTGDRVVHRDIRSDNLLIRPDGRVTIVDWPWAAIGPPWLDTALLLVEVQTTGGHDVAALLEAAMCAFGANPADGYGIFAAFAGYCLHNARLPAPANIPNVRGFQCAQGEALIKLLARGDRPGSGGD